MTQHYIPILELCCGAWIFLGYGLYRCVIGYARASQVTVPDFASYYGGKTPALENMVAGEKKIKPK